MSGEYWIWKSDIYDEQQMVLHRPSRFIRERDLVFDEGLFIPSSSVPHPLEIVPRSGDTGFLTDNVAAPGIRGLLVSGKMRSLMEYEGIDNIQYFHVDSPLGDDSTPPGDYFIANVIGRVRCIDMEESEVSVVDDVVESVDVLKLRVDAAHGLSLFRLDELSTVVVVSDPLKDAVVRSTLTGVEFISTSEFSC